MQPIGPEPWHGNYLCGALAGIGLMIVSACLALALLDWARGYVRARREQLPGFDVKLRKP